MASKPNVTRYPSIPTSSSSPKTSISNKSTTTVTVNKPNPLVQPSTAAQQQQHQKLQMQSAAITAAEQQLASNKLPASNRSMDYSMSGSDTDVSTSNENLSVEQRYVLRHTPRVEPQGQENLAEAAASGSENTGEWILDFGLFLWFLLRMTHSCLVLCLSLTHNKSKSTLNFFHSSLRSRSTIFVEHIIRFDTICVKQSQHVGKSHTNIQSGDSATTTTATTKRQRQHNRQYRSQLKSKFTEREH